MNINLLRKFEPEAFERARRKSVALELLDQGRAEREVSAILRDRFGVSAMTAWRIIQAAKGAA